jgi:hypothetical protein
MFRGSFWALPRYLPDPREIAGNGIVVAMTLVAGGFSFAVGDPHQGQCPNLPISARAMPTTLLAAKAARRVHPRHGAPKTPRDRACEPGDGVRAHVPLVPVHRRPHCFRPVNVIWLKAGAH